MKAFQANFALKGLEQQESGNARLINSRVLSALQGRKHLF